jgi:hypothetical protein
MDRGPYIATYTGKRWYFATPDADDVDFTDVAFALAHANRYTGHAGIYSVATHSLLVADIVRRLGHPEHVLSALVHDAHEAYVGDISAPFKRLLPDYRALERVSELAVRAAFNVPADMPDVVKRADLMALADEARTFWNDVAHWQLPEPPSGLPVPCETPLVAMARWRDAIDLELSRRSDTLPAVAE